MLKRIRHFFSIYTKDEKFVNGYNAMVEAIKDKDWDLMRDLYFCAIDNDYDFDDFDKGLIKAYEDYHNENTTTQRYVAYAKCK